MKSFSYKQPETLEEANILLNKPDGKAFPYAGGTDILGMVKDNLISPNDLVNLKSIKGLDKIQYSSGNGITIGANVKVADVAENPILKKKFTAISEAAESVATPQLRNIGTIGGNVCQRPRCWYFRGEFACLRKGGDECFAISGENKFHCIVGGDACVIVHASDIAVALLAFDASAAIYDGKNTRTIPLSEFFVLPDVDITHENILKAGEIVTQFIIPEKKGKSKYIKVGERGAWDFAVVSVAAVLANDPKQNKLAYGGVAPIPWLEKSVNNKLVKGKFSELEIEQISSDAFKNADPLEKNGYKVQLAKNLTKKILKELT